MDTSIIELVQTKIYNIRDQKVMLDSDLAELYGVEVKRINEAVKNNPDKFPEDFYFELNDTEEESLRSKFSTLKKAGRGQHRKYNTKVFTEQGVYMLATILKSKTATDITVAIMRAFVKMRQFALTYEDIVNQLQSMDKRLDKNEEVLDKVIQALSELINDTKNNETKKIGFIND
jgi:phage regulator Rha-like protein